VDSVWIFSFKGGLNHLFSIKYPYKIHDEKECKKNQASSLKKKHNPIRSLAGHPKAPDSEMKFDSS
jgi:hypothetical protein